MFCNWCVPFSPPGIHPTDIFLSVRDTVIMLEEEIEVRAYLSEQSIKECGNVGSRRWTCNYKFQNNKENLLNNQQYSPIGVLRYNGLKKISDSL
jgi:hypothetical protein